MGSPAEPLPFHGLSHTAAAFMTGGWDLKPGGVDRVCQVVKERVRRKAKDLGHEPGIERDSQAREPRAPKRLHGHAGGFEELV